MATNGQGALATVYNLPQLQTLIEERATYLGAADKVKEVFGGIPEGYEHCKVGVVRKGACAHRVDGEYCDTPRHALDATGFCRDHKAAHGFHVNLRRSKAADREEPPARPLAPPPSAPRGITEGVVTGVMALIDDDVLGQAVREVWCSLVMSARDAILVCAVERQKAKKQGS